MKNKKYTKKRYEKKRKNKLKQKGGIVISANMNEKDAIEHFIDNSDIKLLNVRTGSGLIFISELNPDVAPVYKNIRKSELNKPVRRIIIKLVAVSHDYEGRKKTWDSTIGLKDIERESSFNNECDTQRRVYEDTKSNNDPICPDYFFIYYRRRH